MIKLVFYVVNRISLFEIRIYSYEIYAIKLVFYVVDRINLFEIRIYRYKIYAIVWLKISISLIKLA